MPRETTCSGANRDRKYEYIYLFSSPRARFGNIIYYFPNHPYSAINYDQTYTRKYILPVFVDIAYTEQR